MRPASPLGASRSAASARAAAKTSKRGRVAFVTAVVALIVAVAVIAIVGKLVSRDAPTDETASLSPTSEEAVEQITRTADAFYDAIAAGDAAGARQLADASYVDPRDMQLLTDDMLAASQDFAPLTGVVLGDVSAPDDSSLTARIQASYRLGDQEIETSLPFSRYSDDTWKVDLSDNSMRIPAYWRPASRVEVFGEPVTEDDPPVVFPGLYPLDVTGGVPLGFGNSTGAIALGNGRTGIAIPAADGTALTLTPDATTAKKFWEAVQPSLDACLASTDPLSTCTEGEAQASHAANELAAGTVVRSAPKDDTFRSKIPDVYAGRDNSLIAFANITVDYTATCTDGSTCDGYEFLLYPVVDYSGDRPIVTWERYE